MGLRVTRGVLLHGERCSDYVYHGVFAIRLSEMKREVLFRTGLGNLT